MVEETSLETPVMEVAQVATTETTETTDDKGARDEKGRFSKPPEERIAEVTRKWREQERETEYWRSRDQARAQAASAPKAAEKPTPDKFEDYGAYVEALADWKANDIVDKKLTSREAESEKKRAETEREQKFRARIEKTREGITDYESVMEAAADMRVLDHVSDLIKESDLGAKLLYHFAKNPALLDRLNSLPPQAAAREVGRIEAGLEATKDPTQAEAEAPVITPKKTTAAPAPAKPIGSGRSTSVNLEKASMDEFKAARKAEGARWAR